MFAGVPETFMLGMLAGTGLFSAGLTVGWFMGIAREKIDREREARDVPGSARSDSKPEWAGSR